MRNRRAGLLALLMIALLIWPACSSEKSVEEYLEDGKKHLESGDLSKAIAALEEALKRDPELAEAHRLLGEALGRSERWPEAVTQFEAYKTLASEDAAAYFLLGRAYVRTGDPEQAAATFAEGMRVDPAFLKDHQDAVAGVTDDILQVGQEALEAGDLATATDLLTLVAPLAPGQGESYYLLGQAHLKADDTTQALVAIAQAVQLSPELALEHADEINTLAREGLEMGQTALDVGNLQTALQTMEAVTILLPDEAEAHFTLGNIYNQANQLTQAIEQYQAVLDLDPESSSAHTNMGVVYYKKGELETAIQEYDMALQIEPDDDETHYLLGAAYVQMAMTQLGEGQVELLEQGRAEFETALALNDQLAPAYIGLGNVYLLFEDFESALSALEQAVALAPNSPEAYFALGQVYVNLNDVAQARAAWEHVLSLNPSAPWKEQTERMLESLGSP
jgi:tetratricopeptide (TPR) repeat protein